MQPNAVISALALALISFQAAGADVADELLVFRHRHVNPMRERI
jgi:hypothetical protein